MNNAQLWQSRFSAWLTEINKYLRYIFSSHLIIVLLFLISGASLYYQKWLQTLDASFPNALIASVLIGGVVTFGKVLTFLKNADKVFLLPIETNMRGYFLRSFIASWFLQMILLLIVAVVLMPLIAKSAHPAFTALLLFLFLLKAVNLVAAFYVNFLRDKTAMWLDQLLRLLLNISLVFLFLKETFIYVAAVFLLLMGLTAYYYLQSKKQSLPWERLIELEEAFMSKFYQVANLFTDVPHLQNKVSERKWLAPFLSSAFPTKDRSMKFLFKRTFLRANDYFGLVFRLTVIACLILLFAKLSYGELFIAVLFLYLTGMQLLPIWHHHDFQLWLDLYPLDQNMKKAAVLGLLRKVFFAQTIIFSVLIALDHVKIALFTLVVGVVFVFIFDQYANRKCNITID